MTEKTYHVLGLGNAILDILARTEDGFLDAQGMVKGTMALIDTDRAEAIYAAMGPAIESSGGSAANTIAGLAALGARTAFIGRVADDTLGQVFRHDIRALGVAYDTPAAAPTPPTARCFVLITPDGQRTMNTYLGASVHLSPDDVDENEVARAEILYVEGYLWDLAPAKEACLKAMRAARRNGTRVAFSLSDKFCVDRFRAEFHRLIDDHIDILFANEAEIAALAETDDFDAAMRSVAGRVEIAALTRSEHGSVIVPREGAPVVVEASPVEAVVDTTGAGDLYAAGFLYGLTHGFDLARSARLGGLAAAGIIGQIGPRPAGSIADLVARSA
ncbi:adenosine kinase [Tistrella mobilis]|uniref:adenosine kinase n=1 Tax=Tistrella mobilis TaxID=171437 RepID=UPI0035587555